MEYRNIGFGTCFGWNGLCFMKLDDGGAIVIHHPTQSGTILDFDLDEKVVPLNCEMRFTKREEER